MPILQSIASGLKAITPSVVRELFTIGTSQTVTPTISPILLLAPVRPVLQGSVRRPFLPYPRATIYAPSPR